MSEETGRPEGTGEVSNEIAGGDFYGPVFQAGEITVHFAPQDASQSRERQLDRYLEAAGCAAREHPYVGLGRGTDPPPLTDVYVSQHIRPFTPEGGGASPQGVEDGSPAADELLAQESNCVVLGGPGAGKTSLLRTCVSTFIRRRHDGGRDAVVPVVVPAADLAGALPLSKAIAESVNRGLSLSEALTAELFSAEPHSHVGWLLLVDGLDEIVDSTARRKVLRVLTHYAERGSGSPYRFVVATRPLPKRELDALGTQVLRYELQPFDTGCLGSFAEGWFTALGLPEPHRASVSFTAALERAVLMDLARTPLMATMLCQLYAATPDQPLPTARGEIYRRFIDLLKERQYAAGIIARARAVLEPYGNSALAQADTTLENLPALIDRLAAERHEGNAEPAITVLASQLLAERPDPVPQSVWDEFLGDSLRGSGLLTVRGGDLAFLHQTILEYCAARYGSRDERTRIQALQRLFNGGRPRRRFWPLSIWEPPPTTQASYIGFLLGTVSEDPAEPVHTLLYRTAAKKGMEGCHYIARLARLGTPMPRRIRQTAADRLADHARRIARDVGERELVRVSRALAQLGDPRGADLLYDAACGLGERVRAARALALSAAPGDLDSREPLVDTLGALNQRVRVARALAELGDPRGADLLHDTARDTTIYSNERVRAAHARFTKSPMSLRWEDYGLSEALFSDSSDRLSAARALAELGDPRAADLLHDFARENRPGSDKPVQAAEALAKLGDPRGPELLHRIARETTFYPYGRKEAAEALAKLGDPRGPELLHDLARDTANNTVVARFAAEALAKVGDPRAADLLYDIARRNVSRPYDHTHTDQTGPAAEALAKLGDPRGADLLYDIVCDTRRHTYRRANAAQALAKVGDPRAADLLHDIAHDTSFKTYMHVRAARALLKLEDSRGFALLHDLTRDIPRDPNHRLEVSEGLAELGDPRAANLLHRIARDASDPAHRVRAAEALRKVGDPRGSELLHDLTRDTTLHPDYCARAARALAGLHDQGMGKQF